jgi:hypothetical protein
MVPHAERVGLFPTLILLLLSLVSARAVAAGSQSPVIHDAVPFALAPGKTETVTFFGEHLDGASELWVNCPATSTRVLTQKTNSPGAGQVAFQISVPKTVPVGIVAARLAATNGVSDLYLLMVDDLPGVRETGTNKTLASAQRLEPPLAVEGHCDELANDYYRFHARKGQRLSVEVVANRLGSPLDPLLRLLDATGKELAYCDDDAAAGADARLRFIAPASGEYFVEVRDVGYQGGSRYRYRLRLGDFPLAGSTFPAGARQATQARLQFVGTAVEGLRRADVRVPENAGQFRLNARFGRGRGSGYVTVPAGRLPEVVEQEPNDLPEAATRICPPCVVNGRFEKSKDRDWFEFPAAPGQKLVFSGRTRSLGSPCDLFMQLCGADGKPLAEADISGANEGTLTNTFKDAAVCRLLVEELNRGGGPDFVYRIAIEPLPPGFTLAVETNRVEAAADGTFEIKVAAARREYDGPIALSLDGPAIGFALENEIIPEKKNETALKVKVPAQTPAARLIQFKIRGHAVVSGSEFEATAGTMGALKKMWPLLRYPPGELDGWIGLGIKTAPPPAKAAASAPRKDR